jgi:NAD(P)-dependent dehydrogenase (short-subunit alcohol dehydrogenase family)
MTPEQVIDDYIRQTPLGRLETPEDVAEVVAFLSSDAARFMTGRASMSPAGFIQAENTSL